MSEAYLLDEGFTSGWCGTVDFEALAETLPALIFVTDAQGANLYTNRRLQSFTGRAATALLGTGWLAIIHPDDRDRARQTWCQAVQAAEPYEAAYRLRAADGTYHWHLVRGSAIREDGLIVRWVGSCTNIDDQKQAEAAQARMVEQIGRALAESEERLRLAQEAGGVGSYEWDVTTGTGYVSDSLRRIFGLRADEPAELRTLFSHVHPDDRRTVAAAIARTAAAPDLSITEFRIVRADGEIRWLRDTGRALPDKAGGRTRWMGVVQDVTDQQHAKAKLRASEERLRLALTAGQLGTWTYEVDSGAVSLDNLASLICGLPSSAVRNIETARLLVHADSLDRFDAAVAGMRAGNIEFDDELHIVRGDDDELRWVRLQGVQVQSPEGASPKVFGIIADITSQKASAERERLLAAEGDRRARNVLAGVNALVELTHEDDLARFKAALQGRIRTLTRVHQAVENDGASLARLVADELAPYMGRDRSRIQIGGPMVRLSPQAAIAMSLVLHELAGNAAEQGALAAPGGRLSVTWAMTITETAEGALALRWQERGVPAPRRGFGSNLMRRIVEQRLNGRIGVEPSSDGLRADLVLPVGELLV